MDVTKEIVGDRILSCTMMKLLGRNEWSRVHEEVGQGHGDVQ